MRRFPAVGDRLRELVPDRVGLSTRDGEPRFRLTRRGWVLAGLMVLLVLLGWQYGSRQINTVAVPVLAALVVGVVRVRRASCESVTLSTPPPCVPGEDRTLVVELEGRGLATVTLDVPEGVSLADGATDAETTSTLPTTVEWTIRPLSRGIYELGPLDVRIHGPLGLVERQVTRRPETELVVHPRRIDLTHPTAAKGELHTRPDVVTQEFDHIREYAPGDPLRRIDWKSSAKHDDIHVVEFSERAGEQALVIAGVAARGADDRMTSVVATLAEAALDAGIDVGVVVPDGRCPPDNGPAHRKQLLRLLARTGPSTEAEGYTVTDSIDEETDIVVDAGDPLIARGSREPTVRTAYDTYSVAELSGGSGGGDTDGEATPGDREARV